MVAVREEGRAGGGVGESARRDIRGVEWRSIWRTGQGRLS